MYLVTENVVCVTDERRAKLRAKTLEYLYKLPLYAALPRAKKNELYDSMYKVFEEEAFCEDHNITGKQYTESGSSVFYCGQVIEFSDKAGADNFISDMCELYACCSDSFN